MLPLGLHPLHLAGLVVLGLGILFHIIGLATPSWSVFDNGLIETTLGLFRACLNGNCFGYEDTAPDKVKACQALALIGLIAALTGAALAIFHFMKPRLGRTQDTRIPLYAAIDCSVACFFIILSAIVWAAAVKADTDDIGYSCVLSIIGGLLIGVGGWVLYIAVRKTIDYANVP